MAYWLYGSRLSVFSIVFRDQRQSISSPEPNAPVFSCRLVHSSTFICLNYILCQQLHGVERHGGRFTGTPLSSKCMIVDVLHHPDIRPRRDETFLNVRESRGEMENGGRLVLDREEAKQYP